MRKDLLLQRPMLLLPAHEWRWPEAAVGCGLREQKRVRQQRLPPPSFHDGNPRPSHDLLKLGKTKCSAIRTFQMQREPAGEWLVAEVVEPYAPVGAPYGLGHLTESGQTWKE